MLMMAGLYVTYLSSIIFLLLESLITLTSLASSPRLPLLSSAWVVVSSSLAAPLLYTLLAFSLLRPQQISGQVSLCWADVTSPTSALFLLPVTLLSLTSLTLLLLSYSHPHQDNPRSVTIATNRHSVLAITVLVTIISSLGPVVHTTSTSSPLLWVGYHLARLGLSAAVIVRTLNDTQVAISLCSTITRPLVQYK